MKKSVIVIVLCFVLMGISACGSSGKNVAGTWQQKDDGERIIKVSKDGTYIFYRYGLEDTGYPGTWKSFKDNYYVFEASGSRMVSEGYINDSGELVITRDTGATDTIGEYTFEKK